MKKPWISLPAPLPPPVLAKRQPPFPGDDFQLYYLHWNPRHVWTENRGEPPTLGLSWGGGTWLPAVAWGWQASLFTHWKHHRPASLLPHGGPHSIFHYASLAEAFPSPLREEKASGSKVTRQELTDPQKPTEILKSRTTLHTRYKSLWVSHHTDVGCRWKNPKWAEAPGKALRPQKALLHTAVQQPPPGSQTSLAQCLNTCFKWRRGVGGRQEGNSLQAA